VERAVVDEGGDALAHGELPAVVLASDLLGTAHAMRQRLPPAQLGDLGRPVVAAHGVTPT
jgi:hypothetical protein